MENEKMKKSNNFTEKIKNKYKDTIKEYKVNENKIYEQIKTLKEKIIKEKYKKIDSSMFKEIDSLDVLKKKEEETLRNNIKIINKEVESFILNEELENFEKKKINDLCSNYLNDYPRKKEAAICNDPFEILADQNLITSSWVWKESFKEGIPYLIKDLDSENIDKVHNAIDEFHRITPVKFKEIKDEDSEILESFICFKFYENESCSSVGWGKGVNDIYININDKYNVIIHEIMHNLGFMHEHQRQDRDLFVKSTLKNSDFVIMDKIYAIGPYDPESIMHYKLDTDLQVSDNSLLTKEQKNKLKKLANTFSKGDLESLNFIYGKGNTKCSFEEYGSDFLSQAFYECYDCWGENSVLGCCIPCRFECHKDHNVKYVPPSKELFFCDCGKNKHQLKCTVISTGHKEYYQPIFKCKTCNMNDFCFPCSKKCHIGHQTEIEESFSYCTCDCLYN